MKILKIFTHLSTQITFAFLLLFLLPQESLSQVQVGVTVNSGNATTTCTDPFGGAPDPRWRVKIGTGAWFTYSNGNEDNCFGSYPNLQWSFPFDCQEDIPTTIQVCFRSFEKDGFLCNVIETCLEEICQNYAVPNPGSTADFTLSLAPGGDSGGEVDITIGAIGTPFASANDELCNAENLGILQSGGTLGAAAAGGFNNLCATSTNEPSPSDDGEWVNEQGVWFEFTTSSTPGYEVIINALDDPLNLGNDMNIELAIYESDDGTCTGAFNLIEASILPGDFDESIILDCPEPDKTYFILVDGNDFDVEGEGHFGIEIIDNGAVAAADLRCDAYDFGMIPVGGSLSVEDVHNVCSDNIGDPNPSAFVSQRSVWFQFQAPPSGSVQVEVISVDEAPLNNGIGAQIAVYRSINNTCTGFFIEEASSFSSADGEDESVEIECMTPGDSYWILVDGSGSNTTGIFDIVITDLEFYPPQLTIDTTVCFGGSVSVGSATYSITGNYTFVFSQLNGCDSTVFTNLVIADSLEVDAQAATLASSSTAADGAVTAIETGGVGPYTYLWDDGATTQTNTNVAPGTYCVTITDALDCTAEDCVLLEFSLIAGSATGDALDCFGDMDGTLTFTAMNGSAPYAYEFGNDTVTLGNGIITTDGEDIIIQNLPAGNYQVDIEDADGNMTMASAIISEPTEIITNQDYTLCFGETITIGTNTYATSGGISEILQSVNGCDSTVTGILTILSDPSISIDTMVCFGGSVSVANSMYNVSGNYLDTLLNMDGCDSIITTNLTVLDEIVITLATDILPTGYNQADGTASAQVSGGSGTYTYLWSNGQTTANVNALLGGTEYCVTVTDSNNCTEESCFTILYENNIALAINDTLDCFGDTNGAIILGVANGLGDYDYIWENSDNSNSGMGTITGNFGSATIPNLETGNYNITITDTYVSTVINVAVIEPAPLSAQVITGQSITCVGECNGGVVITPAGGTQPYTYQWSGGIAPIEDPTNLCATIYTVTITDNNGCTTTTTVDIPSPSAFSVTIDESESISCNGENDGLINAIATGGTGNNYQFLWENNTTQSYNAELGAGTYVVTVTDGAGCTITTSYNLTQPSAVNYDLNITDVDCWNGLNSGSVLVENVTGGTAPYVYALGQGSFGTLPSFSQVTAGSYQVYVQDVNGCETNQVAIVNLPSEIEIDLGGDIEINLGETIEIEANTSSNNVQLEWNVDSCQMCPIIEIMPLNTMALQVNALDTVTGCTDSDLIWVIVSRKRKVFVPNAFSPNDDGLNDFLTVFVKDESVRSISNFRVFNRWGAVVFQKNEMRPNNESEGWDGFYNNQKMQAGVYIYSVEIEFIDGETEVFSGDFTLTN